MITHHWTNYRAWLRDWRHCSARLKTLDRELQQAGLQQRDPMYPLIREMALLPDRLSRLLWGLVILIALLLVMGWSVSRLAEAVMQQHYPLPLRVEDGPDDSRLVVIPKGAPTEWTNCSPGYYCLRVKPPSPPNHSLRNQVGLNGPT